MLIESAQYVEFTKTVSGTILFGDVANSDWSNANFASGNDYIVFTSGNGFVVEGSQTAAGFDYTITGGTLVIRVFPKQLGAIGQVS